MGWKAAPFFIGYFFMGESWTQAPATNTLSHPQWQTAGVFARKQHHALSNKAIKKRARHDKHVLAGVLYAPAASATEAVAAPASAMQTEQVFAAAGHAVAAKAKKSAGMIRVRFARRLHAAPVD